MALGHGNKIVTDGLVFYYDMDNRKSWKGEPTTNLRDMDMTTWSITTAITVSEENKYYRIRNTTSTSIHYIGEVFTATDGLTYTFAVDIKQGSLRYVGMSFSSYTGWTGGSGAETYFDLDQGIVHGYSDGAPLAADITLNVDGSYRVSITATRTGTSSSQSNLFLFNGDPLVSRSYTGSLSEYILAKNPQLETKPRPTPFVDGTRTNTTALHNMTNNTSMSISDLTYNADDTFGFDGTNDYFEAIDPSNILHTLDKLTISVWVYKEPSTITRGIIGNGGGYSNSGYGVLVLSTGPIRIELQNAATATKVASDYTIVDQQWHNLIYTWSQASGTLKLYDNGTYIKSSTFNGAIGTPSANVAVGYALYPTYNGGYFLGKIPLAMIYHKELTASEVEQNFNASRGRFGI